MASDGFRKPIQANLVMSSYGLVRWKKYSAWIFWLTQHTSWTAVQAVYLSLQEQMVAYQKLLGVATFQMAIVTQFSRLTGTLMLVASKAMGQLSIDLKMTLLILMFCCHLRL